MPDLVETERRDALALIETPEEQHWLVSFARRISHERPGEWDKAEADFRKALELRPEQPQVMNYLGYSFLEMQTNYEEALDLIERAVALTRFEETNIELDLRGLVFDEDPDTREAGIRLAAQDPAADATAVLLEAYLGRDTGLAMATARKIARPLFMVSFHSSSGFESATTPAPAWT